MVKIPEAHEPGCDPLTVACHVALDHGYRPVAGATDRLHPWLHGADPIWCALPDRPWVWAVKG